MISKRIAIATGLALGALALPTLAQETAEPRQPRPAGEGGEGRGPRTDFINRYFERVAGDLNLDETQRATFDQLVAPHKEEMQNRMQRSGEERRQRREAGDAAAADGTPRTEGDGRRGEGEGGGRRGGGMRFMRDGGGPQGAEQALSDVLDQMEPHLRPEQLEKLDEVRDRMDERRESGDRVRRVMTELPDSLGLDENQKAEWQRMADESRQAAEQRWGEMRPLFEEMRAAREAGDDARVEELRKQMEASRPRFDEQLAPFLSQVETILTEEQKAKLNEFRAEAGIGQDAADAPGGVTDVRTLLKAAKRVKLKDDQKEAFRALESESMRAWRQAGRDADARAAVTEKARADLREMFDETQQGRFDQLIERLDRRAQKR